MFIVNIKYFRKNFKKEININILKNFNNATNCLRARVIDSFKNNNIYEKTFFPQKKNTDKFSKKSLYLIFY